MMSRLLLSTFFLILTTTLFSQQIKWEVDTVFSEITFDVNHLIFSTVDGEFFGFEGTAYSDSADFSDVKITFVIYPNSLLTDNNTRDEVLKSEKFMNVDQYKTMVFTSTNVKNIQGETPQIEGYLTMFGEKKLVSLDLILKGVSKDNRARDVADFIISGTIYPNGWGWNNPPFVSKKVDIAGKIRLIKIGRTY